MECVYKVAVIAEICDCCCLGIFQRIVTVLTVAVPLGQTVWMLGRKLAPESAIYSGNAGHDAPLPHHVPLPSCGFSWIFLHSFCSFVLGWPRRVKWSLCWRHGFLLSLHPRGLQVSTLSRFSRALWAAARWGWGPRAPDGTCHEQLLKISLLMFWLGSAGSLVYLCLEGLRLLLEISISFPLYFQLPFFNLYFKCPVLKLICRWFMDISIITSSFQHRNSQGSCSLVSLFHSLSFLLKFVQSSLH